MSPLIKKLFAVHDALDRAGVPHAVGGAIALAFTTRNPRGTRDLDLNIFLKRDQAARVLGSLPDEVAHGPDDVAEVHRHGQVRLWWDETPVDLFFNTLPLHDDVARGKVMAPLAGRDIPILDAGSLVLFKVMFDRSKDWADVEEILAHDPGAVARALPKVAGLIGPDDPITRRLAGLVGPPSGVGPEA